MTQNRLTLDQLQNQYVDALIGLAFEEMDALEAQEALAESEQLPPETEAAATAVFLRVKERIRREYNRQRRKTHRQSFQKALPRILEIAAVLVLLVGIAAPVAIAGVSSIRVKVLEMLMTFEDDHVEINMHEKQNAAFYVPGNYLGDYFPAYLPEGFEYTYISQLSDYIEMQNLEGQRINFGSFSEYGGGNFDTENAKLSYVTLHDQQVLLIEKKGLYTIIWEMDNRVFYVDTTISPEETVRIAESVRRIPK